MHELSIVQSLVELCEKNFKDKQADFDASSELKIREVVVKIGVLSGVEPHYLQSAYDAYKIGTVCQDAKLSIIEQPVVVKCLSCACVSQLEKYEFNCPKCKSTELEVVDGEEMYLMKLVIK